MNKVAYLIAGVAFTTLLTGCGGDKKEEVC